MTRLVPCRGLTRFNLGLDQLLEVLRPPSLKTEDLSTMPIEVIIPNQPHQGLIWELREGGANCSDLSSGDSERREIGLREEAAEKE